MTQIINYLFYIVIFFVITLLCVLVFFFYDLPDDSSLQNYKPNVMTRIHASNGDLVKEFSREYRIFIPAKDIPENLKNAFISAEDKNFYSHLGVDPIGILRAFIKNSVNILSDTSSSNSSQCLCSNTLTLGGAISLVTDMSEPSEL